MQNSITTDDLLPSACIDGKQMLPAVLRLTLKKKWFDMIAAGIKKEEYREIKWHWVCRMFEVVKPLDLNYCSIYYKELRSMFHFCVGYKGTRLKAIKYLIENGYIKPKHFDSVVFKNGYNADAPEITIKYNNLKISTAVPEWSDNWQGECFVISLGEIVQPAA